MPERPERVTVDKKACPRCKKTKPWNEFNMNASAKSGLGTYCKLCSTTDAALRYRREREQAGFPVPPMPTHLAKHQPAPVARPEPPQPIPNDVLSRLFQVAEVESNDDETSLRFNLAELIIRQQGDILRQLIQ